MAKKIDYKWTSLLESLKEPARLLVLALIAWLLTVIVPQLDEKWVPVITLVLRFADKWVYEYKKETKTEGSFKGVVGF
jgi:hypothetical protein